MDLNLHSTGRNDRLDGIGLRDIGFIIDGGTDRVVRVGNGRSDRVRVGIDKVIRDRRPGTLRQRKIFESPGIRSDGCTGWIGIGIPDILEIIHALHVEPIAGHEEKDIRRAAYCRNRTVHRIGYKAIAAEIIAGGVYYTAKALIDDGSVIEYFRIVQKDILASRQFAAIEEDMSLTVNGNSPLARSVIRQVSHGIDKRMGINGVRTAAVPYISWIGGISGERDRLAVDRRHGQSDITRLKVNFPGCIMIVIKLRTIRDRIINIFVMSGGCIVQGYQIIKHCPIIHVLLIDPVVHARRIIHKDIRILFCNDIIDIRILSGADLNGYKKCQDRQKDKDDNISNFTADGFHLDSPGIAFSFAS